MGAILCEKNCCRCGSYICSVTSLLAIGLSLLLLVAPVVTCFGFANGQGLNPEVWGFMFWESFKALWVYNGQLGIVFCFGTRLPVLHVGAGLWCVGIVMTIAGLLVWTWVCLQSKHVSVQESDSETGSNQPMVPIIAPFPGNYGGFESGTGANVTPCFNRTQQPMGVHEQPGRNFDQQPRFNQQPGFNQHSQSPPYVVLPATTAAMETV